MTPISPPLPATEQFKRGMGRFATHVTIITTCSDDGVRCGLTATAVTSLTADPPTLVACVNKDTFAGSILPATGRFCVNVLSREQQSVAEVFAGLTDLCGPRRFDAGRWTTAVTGAPVLRGALASFDCRLQDIVEHSTHWLVVGNVEATILPDVDHDTTGEALLYVGRQFAGIGTAGSPSDDER